jgi:hypothetical protein
LTDQQPKNQFLALIFYQSTLTASPGANFGSILDISFLDNLRIFQLKIEKKFDLKNFPVRRLAQ